MMGARMLRIGVDSPQRPASTNGGMKSHAGCNSPAAFPWGEPKAEGEGEGAWVCDLRLNIQIARFLEIRDAFHRNRMLGRNKARH